MEFQNTIEFAHELDRQDRLASFRNEFHFPKQANGEDVIYLCGNSLGLQPKSTGQAISQELEDWRKLGVRGHMKARNPWMPYHELIMKPMAEVVGALPNEVAPMNTLTSNLHFLMVSFYRPNGKKYKVVMESSCFPSDYYAVKSQIRYHGYDEEDGVIIISPDDGENYIKTEKILETLRSMQDEIAMLLLGGVNYYSGQFFEMEKITGVAHECDIVAGYDLAHGAGNVLLNLHAWGVDFAAWCTYKYLNAGPGGIACYFIHEKHHNASLPRFEGWWGHDKDTRFQMSYKFIPIPTAEAWQLSNPPIFQLAALKSSLDLFAKVGMLNLVEKSKLMASYMRWLLLSVESKRFEIITPEDERLRGCQISIRIKDEDKSIFERISDSGVICDWREPDVIRIAIVPLYNSFEDAYKFYEIFKNSIEKQ